MPVNIIENFISKDYANNIIRGSEVFLRQADPPRSSYFEDVHKRTATPKEKYGENIDPRVIDEASKISDMFLSDSVYLTKTYLENFYKIPLDNYECGLVKTVTGAQNGLHSDMYMLDGSQWDDGSGREDEFEYSALLYLSDYGVDFLGGEVSFPQHKLTILPKAGTLVFFRGDLDHLHEVSMIESGSRYAMIMFFGK